MRLLERKPAQTAHHLLARKPAAPTKIPLMNVADDSFTSQHKMRLLDSRNANNTTVAKIQKPSTSGRFMAPQHPRPAVSGVVEGESHEARLQRLRQHSEKLMRSGAAQKPKPVTLNKPLRQRRKFTPARNLFSIAEDAVSPAEDFDNVFGAASQPGKTAQRAEEERRERREKRALKQERSSSSVKKARKDAGKQADTPEGHGAESASQLLQTVRSMKKEKTPAPEPEVEEEQDFVGYLADSVTGAADSITGACVDAAKYFFDPTQYVLSDSSSDEEEMAVLGNYFNGHP